MVSGGGWAVGDLDSAVHEALDAGPDVHVVVLCGRNEDVLAAMESHFGADPRVHVSGFTEHMNELFAAADVLVHSTAGLTVLEALHPRLPRHLLRLGDRAHPRQQRAHSRATGSRAWRPRAPSSRTPSARRWRSRPSTARRSSQRCVPPPRRVLELAGVRA